MHNNNKGWQYKWQEWEDSIIREYYPKNGYEKVLNYLPYRNQKGVQSRAFKLGIRYLSYNENYFSIINSPTKAYWLGFLYVDGYVTTNNRWGLELSEVDKSHIEKLLLDFECNIKLKDRERKNGSKSYSFQINNSKMHQNLIDFGVVMNKTYDLKFPCEKILPQKYLSHFIRGFFDGDGCITFSNKPYIRKDRNNRVYDNLRKSVSFVCKSEEFLLRLQTELKSNNISFQLYYNPKDNLPTLQIANKESISKFYDYIYKDSNIINRLDRKYEKFQELLCHF